MVCATILITIFLILFPFEVVSASKCVNYVNEIIDAARQFSLEGTQANNKGTGLALQHLILKLL